MGSEHVFLRNVLSARGWLLALISLSVAVGFSDSALLANIPFPRAIRPDFVMRNDYKLGDWRLTVRKDRFSSDKQCRLRSKSHKIFYENGVVGFRFGRKTNTLEA